LIDLVQQSFGILETKAFMKGITSMFHRIGDAEVVSLDQESAISRMAFNADQQQVTLHFHAGSSATIKPHDEDYNAYVQFIHACPPLVEQLETQRLVAIRTAHTNPELEEMPRTLFAVFQSLPGADGLELRLDQTGMGALWTKETNPRCVSTWNTFDEGLTTLLRVGKGK
jgi:hypothetical protein